MSLSVYGLEYAFLSYLSILFRLATLRAAETTGASITFVQVCHVISIVRVALYILEH